jgi:flagellar motor switch protein FliM/N
MKPRAFRLLGATERGRVAAVSREAFARWAGAWFGTAADGGIDVRPAEHVTEVRCAEARALARAADGARWAAVLAGPGAYRAAAARFAAQAGEGWAPRAELPPVVRGAVEECYGALAAELVAAAGASPAPADADVDLEAAYRHASGAALAAGALDGERILAVLSADLVSALCGAVRPAARGGLARRADCIQGATLELRAVAGAAELGIGALLSVAPGDVIVLDARIDQTFSLSGPGGVPLGRGFLGSSAGAKALQLVSQGQAQT